MANADPTTPRKDPTQAMLENIRFMRENGYSAAEINAEIQRWAPKIAAFNAAEMQREDPMGLAEMSPAAANIRAGARAGLEALQTVASGFPGAQLAMSGLRAATSGVPVEEAKRQIQAETTDVPYASAVGRMAGGLPLMAAGGAIAGRAPQALRGALQAAGRLPVARSGAARLIGGGAGLAAGEQLLSGAPGMEGRRLESALEAGAVGAVAAPIAAGVARGLFGAADIARALLAPSRATQQMGARAQREAVTGPMFRAAERAGQQAEAAGIRTGVLDDPEIQPYVLEIMDSPSFRKQYPNPTEQDLIKATREYILDVADKAQSAAAAQAARGTQRIQAGTVRAAKDAQALADRLTEASDVTTGGQYRGVLQEYAKRSEAMRLGQQAGDVTRATVAGKWTPSKRLTTESPEAFMQRVPSLAREEAQAALPMARAALAESVGLSFSPLSGFGIPRSAQRIYRARKVFQPLEQVASGGQAMTPKSLKDYLLAAGIGY